MKQNTFVIIREIRFILETLVVVFFSVQIWNGVQGGNYTWALVFSVFLSIFLRSFCSQYAILRRRVNRISRNK